MYKFFVNIKTVFGIKIYSKAYSLIIYVIGDKLNIHIVMINIFFIRCSF